MLARHARVRGPKPKGARGQDVPAGTTSGSQTRIGEPGGEGGSEGGRKGGREGGREEGREARRHPRATTAAVVLDGTAH